MPFKSTKQRGWMYATHPEMAERWEAETPKGKKLPERVVKKAFNAGVAAALSKFGASEEIRLQLPKREYHGLDAAVRSATKGEKKAEGPDAEMLAEALRTFDEPGKEGPDVPSKNILDRDTMWGVQSNLAAGDVGSRISGMGQDVHAGPAF